MASTSTKFPNVASVTRNLDLRNYVLKLKFINKSTFKKAVVTIHVFSMTLKSRQPSETVIFSSYNINLFIKKEYKIFVLHKHLKHHLFGWFLFPAVRTLWHSVANNVLRPPHKMSRSVLRIFEAAEVFYKCTAANWVPIGSLFSLSWVFNLIGSSVSASWIQNLFNDLMWFFWGYKQRNCKLLVWN